MQDTSLSQVVDEINAMMHRSVLVHAFQNPIDLCVNPVSDKDDAALLRVTAQVANASLAAQHSRVMDGTPLLSLLLDRTRFSFNAKN